MPHPIQATYRELVVRDWRKYLGFILGMRGLGVLSPRGRFLEHYYAFMRHADDVADRDSAPPDGVDPIEYLLAKREFVRAPRNPRDVHEQLYVRATELAAELGFDVSEESDALLESLIFDARRYGTAEIFPSAVLDQYYFDRDIVGTARTMLKALGDDSTKVDLLWPLCTATRMHYDMADFDIDVRKGFINIASEDVARAGIGPGDLFADSPKIRALFAEQAQRGLDLLREHARVRSAFKPLTRSVFPCFYVLPCKRAFLRLAAERRVESV